MCTSLRPPSVVCDPDPVFLLKTLTPQLPREEVRNPSGMGGRGAGGRRAGGAGGKGWVCFLSPPSPAPLEVSVETAAEKGRVKVTQPEPKRGRVEEGEMERWRERGGTGMGKRQKWSSDGARSRRGAERDGEIGQRGRHRETSHMRWEKGETEWERGGVDRENRS